MLDFMVIEETLICYSESMQSKFNLTKLGNLRYYIAFTQCNVFINLLQKTYPSNESRL